MGRFIEVDRETNTGCCGCGNPECTCGNENGGTDSDQPATSSNISMYDYLKDFDKMSDQEKAALFLPMVEFFYTENSYKQDAGAAVSKGIMEVTLKTGRVVDDIQFQMSHQGVYTVMVVFKPLDMRMIRTQPIQPDLREKIVQWGTMTGMLKISSAYGDEIHQTGY